MDPTPVITTTLDTIQTFVDIPGPFPLPPVDQALDLAPFWNVPAIMDMISVIQTFFYFENIPEFFKIFIFVMGVVIGLRLIFAIIGARQTAERTKGGPQV